MQLIQALEYALTYLGDEDPTVTVAATMHPDRKLSLLLQCANMVRKEIAFEYLPLVATETVEHTQDAFSYDALSHRVLRILQVQDANRGIRLRFRMHPDRCEVPASAGKLVVQYQYQPEDISFTDDCGLPPSVTARTLALGIAAEYCLIQGMYEQSVLFSDRFADDMRSASRRVGEARVKPRRWQ